MIFNPWKKRMAWTWARRKKHCVALDFFDEGLKLKASRLPYRWHENPFSGAPRVLTGRTQINGLFRKILEIGVVLVDLDSPIPKSSPVFFQWYLVNLVPSCGEDPRISGGCRGRWRLRFVCKDVPWEDDASAREKCQFLQVPFLPWSKNVVLNCLQNWV